MSQNEEYQTGGYANYQGQPGEPIMSPQPQPEVQPTGYGYPEQPPYQQQQGYAAPPGYAAPSGYAEQPGYPEQPKQEYDENEAITYAVRRGFIVKTYGILLSQLAITTAFICLTFIDSVKEVIRWDISTHPLIAVFLIIFIVVTIVVFCVFACCHTVARKVPINYILLFSFTLCMSFYLCLLCSELSTSTVFSALVLTFGATLGLTVYAWKTKTDYTYCGAFLFACIFLLIITACLFFWIRYTVFYCLAVILIYSLYIIYDTQLIIGNKTFKFDIDEYCLAALNLYIDIIYMFIRILQLLAMIKGN